MACREKVGSGTARADFSGNPDAAVIAVDPVALAKPGRNIESRIGLGRDGREHDKECSTGMKMGFRELRDCAPCDRVVLTIGTGRIEVKHDR